MSKYTEVILAAVTKLRRHPTAEQVFLEMKKEHPSIALGTVYKHLNALADEGLLLRITEPGSSVREDNGRLFERSHRTHRNRARAEDPLL